MRYHDGNDLFYLDLSKPKRLYNTTGMLAPVRCRHCDHVYDAGSVTVTVRYSDCSMWVSPCCHREVDDREWKSLPDIEKLY